MCHVFLFSIKGLELQLATCRLPARHEGTSIEYVHKVQAKITSPLREYCGSGYLPNKIGSLASQTYYNINSPKDCEC